MTIKPKILVTGSCGFIFSNFIRYCIYNKVPYRFVSIDKVQENATLHNVYINKNHEFYIGDITDKHFIDVVFNVEKPDIVIHAAANSHVDKSIQNATSFVYNNVYGTQVIIDACVKYKVKKLVYVETDEVYGHLTDMNASAWTEDSPVNPRNPYSASKLAGGLLVKAAHETHGLMYNITRCCNNYGARQTQDKFIPKIIKSIIKKERMPIYGRGLQIRDWLFVEDHCKALLKILSDGKDNETYNISANQEISNIDVFNNICDIFKSGHELIQFVDDRPGHDFRYSVDSSKLRNLGWKPEFDFDSGIRSCAEWYVHNQNFWFN